MAPSQRPSVIRAATIARTQTYLSFTAFLTALLLGCALHYKKIVKNGVAGYPEEWFPSVSATIGDWYPERNVFQILIALNSGPRFILVYLQYYLHRNAYPSTCLPGVGLAVGVLRTLACGGWVYITSTDNHDAHDILMINYIVLNVPWMYISAVCTPQQHAPARRRRRNMALAFFGSMIPMIYFFIQHKVHRIPGAYTQYSFFEWSLIIFDILYDSAIELELRAADLKIAILTPGPVGGDEISSTASETLAMNRAAPTAAATESKVVSKKPTAGRVPYEGASNTVTTAEQSNAWTTLRTIADFSSDVYLSFVYWSVITSLTPTLFYFSVWELALTGSELSLLALPSPILFVVPLLFEACASRTGRTVLHVLSLVGLGSYALADPLHRLFAVILAAIAANLGTAADWFSGDGDATVYNSFILVLGFFATSLLKLANHSVNPVWPMAHEKYDGYHKSGIFLAIVAICSFYTRRQPASKPNAVLTYNTPRPNWFATGLSLGSWLFTIHYLLGDGGTLIAWSWSGYPIRGPVPNQHASLTHVAQAVGILLPVAISSLTGSVRLLETPLWFAYGAVSAYAMYAYRDWLGYAGGANLVVFLMSIAPVVLQRTKATGRVVLTLFTAWLLVGILYVTSVFTVAYAFVPFGEYLRERTELILSIQMAALAFVFRWPAVTSPLQSLTVPSRVKALTSSTIVLMTIASFLVSFYHWPSIVPLPHREGSRIVRAGIWTVHFGIDNEGKDSQRRMLHLIRDMELDVVGLLETDLHRTVFGNRDLTLLMAEELGFYVDIGPGPEKHTWGAVLLSKFPIINSTHHLLPSPYGELAPAIEAVLDMYGTEVTVVVAHNGQEETPLDRELQATELARIMAKTYPQPVIFLGYVVTKPLADRPAPYQIMVEDGKVHDIDRYDWDRWCEYIFYRGLYRTAYARVSRSTITDTELQIGQFILPRHGFSVVDDSEEARYNRAFKEQVPEDHWFPMEYYPETGGQRGHFYHVFDTPLYYHVPEGAHV